MHSHSEDDTLFPLAIAIILMLAVLAVLITVINSSIAPAIGLIVAAFAVGVFCWMYIQTSTY
jgi:hypothetical protein